MYKGLSSFGQTKSPTSKKLFAVRGARFRETRRERARALSSPEIMKRIAEAEKESQHVLDQAERDVTRMKRELPSRIAFMREQILQEAARQRQTIMMEAERVGAEEAERVTSDTRNQIEALPKMSQARRSQAIQKAIDLLLS